MTNYAHIEEKTAFLSTEFGENIARKWFGDERVDAMPRYIKGKRKGMLKGIVVWQKIVRGGWVKTARATANGDAEGYVEHRVGMIFGKKLCEIMSNQYGVGIGNTVVDLDTEEWKRQAKEAYELQKAEELSKLNADISRLEEALGKVEEEHVETLQSVIDDLKNQVKQWEK